MSAQLLVLRPGAGVSIQDVAGRRHFRALGAPPSGALDPRLLAAANLLAGAPAEAAGLEILLAGPELICARGPMLLGFAGDLRVTVTRAHGAVEAIGGWRSLRLAPGDRLAVKILSGAAYIGCSGGLATAEILGSRAIYPRAGFGAALAAGDLLPCAASDAAETEAPALSAPSGPFRVLPGPQQDYFGPEALAQFYAARWRVGAQSDRMGLRLTGPRLEHGSRGANIVSDGVTPGAIQIPGDGQPIILRADGQTSGGYAKIACVISADLPRLAHLAPGDEIGFTPTDQAGAAEARRAAREIFGQWAQKIAPRRGFDERALWRENLISGASAGADDFFGT